MRQGPPPGEKRPLPLVDVVEVEGAPFIPIDRYNNGMPVRIAVAPAVSTPYPICGVISPPPLAIRSGMAYEKCAWRARQYSDHTVLPKRAALLGERIAN